MYGRIQDTERTSNDNDLHRPRLSASVGFNELITVTVLRETPPCKYPRGAPDLAELRTNRFVFEMIDTALSGYVVMSVIAHRLRGGKPAQKSNHLNVNIQAHDQTRAIWHQWKPVN